MGLKLINLGADLTKGLELEKLFPHLKSSLQAEIASPRLQGPYIKAKFDHWTIFDSKQTIQLDMRICLVLSKIELKSHCYVCSLVNFCKSVKEGGRGIVINSHACLPTYHFSAALRYSLLCIRGRGNYVTGNVKV